MHRRPRQPHVCFAAAVLFAVTIASTARAQATLPSYPDSKEGLHQYFKDVLGAVQAKDGPSLVAMCQSLALPDPDKWFKRTFGDKTGEKLAADYKSKNKNLGPTLAQLFARIRAPAELEPRVVCVETIDDPSAKTFQRLAMGSMVEPVPLYSVALMSKQNVQPAMEIWSIVYVDGAFRLVGKMTAIKDVDIPKTEDANNP